MRVNKTVTFLISILPVTSFVANPLKKCVQSKAYSTDPNSNNIPQTDTFEPTYGNILDRMRRSPEGQSLARPLEDSLAALEAGRKPPLFEPQEYVEAASLSDQIFTKKAPIKIQGGSLKTWTYNSAAVEAVHVAMRTEGRPLDADIQLWKGPENTPTKLRVYVEDGAERHFSCLIATPRGPNTIAIRNTGQLEFPLDASVVADTPDIIAPTTKDFGGKPLIIQGGALRTFPFGPNVESVQVLLNTDGRPLNARIELLQGPNNIKQVVEVYTEDGLDRPFMMVLETPGFGNVVRVVNSATIEFPLNAVVEAYKIKSKFSEIEPILGGDSNDDIMPIGRRSF